MIYTIGETVLDIAMKGLNPLFAVPGGSALNTSVTLGRLGCEVAFLTELGSDKIAMEIINFLQLNNINTRFITQYQNSETSIALAHLDNTNSATYSFYKKLPAQRKINTSINFKLNDYLLFSSSFAVNNQIRNELENILTNANKRESCIFYDPNIRFSSDDIQFEQKKAYANSNISYADIVRCSDEDCVNLFETSNAEQSYKAVQKCGCSFFIYTQSSKGVTVHIKDRTFQFRSKNINPISTIGAGDTFNAGVLFGLQKFNITKKNLFAITDEQVERIINYAIECATFVCLTTENYISNEFAKQIIQQQNYS